MREQVGGWASSEFGVRGSGGVSAVWRAACGWMPSARARHLEACVELTHLLTYYDSSTSTYYS